MLSRNFLEYSIPPTTKVYVSFSACAGVGMVLEGYSNHFYIIALQLKKFYLLMWELSLLCVRDGGEVVIDGSADFQVRLELRNQHV
jgi:hypothetical protein